ncbi:hypothetical protein HID58_095367 [Brassica napus]|uniref:Uncharacterized protein n=1 Tax=Brassica napus TaxID=3708 RepID=A0ABQ7X3X5_BRANA|nr:hypothetical protein HID58_095367 [Brassica napus]
MVFFQIETNLRFFLIESEYESDLPRKPRPEQSKRRRVLALATLVFCWMSKNERRLLIHDWTEGVVC